MLRNGLSLALLGGLAFLFHCSSDPAVTDDDKKDGSVQGDDDDDVGDDDDAPSKDGGSTPGKDATSDATSSSSSSGGGDSGAFTDYAEVGPNEIETVSDTETVTNGCEMSYVRHRPKTATPVATIVMAHGFLGNVEDLGDVADHLARWGADVIVAPLCESGQHAKNGTALSQLATQLALPAPYFGGFSAGGLAGFLAASQNAQAAGFIGLDPVDADDLALAAAPLTVPARAVLTESSSCNATANFVAVLAKQSTARGVRIVGAEHFDMQTACRFLSGCPVSGCAQTTPEHHTTAMAFATAALLELSGADPAATGYFTPGSQPYDQQLADGVIAAP